MDVTIVHSSAPGKMLLIGEYAVLHGAPALVMALNRRVDVRLFVGKGGRITCTASPLGVSRQEIDLNGDMVQPELELVRHILRAFARKYPHLEPAKWSFHVELCSKSFYQGATKLGIGSSAAVAVALWGALFGFFLRERVLNKDAEFAAIREAHLGFQDGQGSGVDIAASLFGGLLEYRMSDSVRVLPHPPVWDWTILCTGRAASTKELTRAVEDVLEDDESAQQHLRRMADIAGRAASSWHREAYQDVLSALAEYQEAMDTLGQIAGTDIISAEHRLLQKAMVGEGTVYKTSGAGGGDIGFVMGFESKKNAEVIDIAGVNGFESLPAAIDVLGLEIRNHV